MSGVTLEQARAAKRKLSNMLDGLDELAGLGIAVLPTGYGVKVNLSRRAARVIPSEIDGVTIVVDVVGGVLP